MRLLVYLEPTPYILALWRELSAVGSGDMIVFCGVNVTQAWDLDANEIPGCTTLKGALTSRIRHLNTLLSQPGLTLVHLAGWAGPLLLFALLSARLRGLPVVVESDTQLRRSLPLWKRAVKRVVYPLFFRCVSRFLPAGSRQVRYLQHYGVESERIRVAQMTVDVDGIRAFADGAGRARRDSLRASHGAGAETLVFLFVGRLEPMKGLDILFGAFRSVLTPALLLIVGEGTLRGEVRSAALSDARIRTLGRLTGDALLEVFAAADVLVLPSTAESWGLVVNEALAMGLPVIASDAVGSVDDLVLHGRTGFVAPAGDAQALGRAMAQLAREPGTRRAMAARGRELISSWRLADEAAIIVKTWKEVERG